MGAEVVEKDDTLKHSFLCSFGSFIKEELGELGTQ